MIVKFKRLEHGAGLPLPAYQTSGSSGMDICAAGSGTIPPGRRASLSTGFAIAHIPEGFELQCRPRSGLASRHGLTVLNTPGTIDSDYRGEVIIVLMNHGSKEVQIKRGQRIAQLVLNATPRAVVVEEEGELGATDRGAGGFGSTGS